jgi:mono/diheme cytochrome c family protein
MKRTLFLVVFLTAACGVDDTTSTTSSITADCASNTDTWSTYGQAFFTTNCRSCHQHTSQFGTQAAVTASLSSIKSEISSGKMPEGTTLSATDKARILAYLSCGAP